MRIKLRDKGFTCLTISAGLVIASWFGGAQLINKKTQELMDVRTELRAECDERMRMLEKKEEYLENKKSYNEAYDRMLEEYPEGISSEHQILFVAGLEEQFDIQVVSLSYTEEEPIYNFESLEKGNEKPYMLTSASIQIPVLLDYEDFKSFLDYIFAYEDKSVVSELTAGYDAVMGKVGATVVVTQYAVKGDGRERKEHELMIPVGSENLFLAGTKYQYSGSKAEQIEAIKKSHSCYMMLYPSDSDVQAKVIAGPNEQEKVISEGNQEETLVITAQERDEVYSLTYTLGEDRPRVLYELEGETIDVYVLSSQRRGDTDLSGVRVQIDNQTSKPMRIAVVGDDSKRPRFVVEHQSGDVEILR